MAPLNVKIEPETSAGSVNVSVKPKETSPKKITGVVKTSGPIPKKYTVTHNITAKRTMDGEIMITDHPEIDIILIPKKMQIVVFPKSDVSDETYIHANILFKHLDKKKIIKPESIRSGATYGSLQADIRKSVSDDIDPLQMAIHNIGEYLDEESKYLEYTSEIKKEMEKRLFEPDDDETTEFGEVPHEVQKGSIIPGTLRRFGQGFYYIYENKENK